MPDDTKRHVPEDLAKALTSKQRQFCDTYLLNGLNGSAAAQAVGYRNPAESRRTLALPHVVAYVRARLEEAGFTAEAILRRLEYFAAGDMQDFLSIAPSERTYWIRADEHEELHEIAKRRGIEVDALDNYDVSGILGAHNVAQTQDGVLMVCVKTVDAEVTIDWRRAERHHALGRVKKIKLNKDGTVEFELHDPVKTLELLGKAHKMWTDKVEHSGELGVIGIRITPPAGVES